MLSVLACAVAAGRAIRVETESLVLGTLRGPVTVLVDDPGLDDVRTGDPVGVRGTWNVDGTLQSTGMAVLGGVQVRPTANGRQ